MWISAWKVQFHRSVQIVKRCDTSATSVTEQAEEVCWLLFIVNRHVWTGAKVGRVELTGVGDPNDVVEQAREKKDSAMTSMRATNMFCFSEVNACPIKTLYWAVKWWGQCKRTLSAPIQTCRCGTLYWQECIRIQWPCLSPFLWDQR